MQTNIVTHAESSQLLDRVDSSMGEGGCTRVHCDGVGVDEGFYLSWHQPVSLQISFQLDLKKRRYFSCHSLTSPRISFSNQFQKEKRSRFLKCYKNIDVIN